MPRVTKNSDKSKRRQAPAKTVEARENQLIALTVDLAEKQIREGKVSSQVMTHFLKLGSTRERLEKDSLIEEVKLLKAKTEQLQSAKKIEELMADAIKAFRTYNPQQSENDEDNNVRD
jgi:hypothetical protein